MQVSACYDAFFKSIDIVHRENMLRRRYEITTSIQIQPIHIVQQLGNMQLLLYIRTEKIESLTH